MPWINSKGRLRKRSVKAKGNVLIFEGKGFKKYWRRAGVGIQRKKGRTGKGRNKRGKKGKMEEEQKECLKQQRAGIPCWLVEFGGKGKKSVRRGESGKDIYGPSLFKRIQETKKKNPERADGKP